jgi:superfamily I DNA/RNA helicase
MVSNKADRAALLTAEHWGLNAEQTAAFHDDGDTVVIACPGSGKTRLSIAKAVKYVLLHGTDSVLMVTFSKQAANEMRKRLAARVGDAMAKKVKIGTYHGLGHELLRAHYKATGRKYSVVSDSQSYAMMFRARDKIAKNIPNDEVIAGIARIKATFLTDEEVVSRNDPISFIFFEYQRMLASFNAKDFADLVRESTRLFMSGEMKPFAVRNLLADEFQDSDRMQYQWLLAHSTAGAKLHSVGDDDQSIYGFRNALGHLALRGLAEDIGASVHYLSTNYRCGRDIVLVADQVISENLGRIKKDFKVGSQLAGKVMLAAYHDAAAEAEAVIQQFEALVDSREIVPDTNEFAVMHRTNFGLDYLDMAAVGCKYTVIREGKSSFIDRPHVSQALAALRLGIEPRNRLGWFGAVELAGMSPDGVNRFVDYIQKLPDRADMEDAMYAREWIDGLGRQDKTLFGLFRNVLMDWTEAVIALQAEGGPDEDCAKPVLVACEKLGELSPNRNHRKDIAFLGRILANRLKGSLANRLLRVSQKSNEALGEDGPTHGPVLKLMTLHSGKGLEFDAAWLIGVSDGSLPIADSDLEEERRLFYVGITRAKAKLHISYVKSADTKPSRFLDCLMPAAKAA